NRQLALVEILKAKLSRLESGLLDETDIKERLKDVPEIEDLKQQVKDAEKELNAKIAKEKSLLDNIEKLNAELERVKNV
ncbi:hypothetical protein, partial [Pseudomonas urmiensis]|uniref:hypothetical protein n=1 Tax=Pseudomonas urmiensis TaxID=2745493 RepID=UPI0034D5413C